MSPGELIRSSYLLPDHLMLHLRHSEVSLLGVSHSVHYIRVMAKDGKHNVCQITEQDDNYQNHENYQYSCYQIKLGQLDGQELSKNTPLYWGPLYTEPSYICEKIQIELVL